MRDLHDENHISVPASLQFEFDVSSSLILNFQIPGAKSAQALIAHFIVGITERLGEVGGENAVGKESRASQRAEREGRSRFLVCRKC